MADANARQSRSSYVLCVHNRGYRASLERGKVYRQISDAWAQNHDLVRIVDESGDDYLYPRRHFFAVAVPKAARTALQK